MKSNPELKQAALEKLQTINNPDLSAPLVAMFSVDSPRLEHQIVALVEFFGKSASAISQFRETLQADDKAKQTLQDAINESAGTLGLPKINSEEQLIELIRGLALNAESRTDFGPDSAKQHAYQRGSEESLRKAIAHSQ